MSTNSTLNTILLPVISACAMATVALIAGGQWVLAGVGVILTFGASALYDFLP